MNSPHSLFSPHGTSGSPLLNPREGKSQNKHSPLQNSLMSLCIAPDPFVLSPETHNGDLAAESDSPKSEAKGEDHNTDMGKARENCADCVSNPSGNPCSTHGTQNLVGGEDFSNMDVRKQKRMVSNRESARRSRLRKQQHLDDLRLQVQKLQNENVEMVQKFGIASQNLTRLNEENSRLRSHALDLGHKLQKLHHAAKARNLPRSHELDLGLSHLDSFLSPLPTSVPMHYPPIPAYPRQTSLSSSFLTPYIPSAAPELSK